MSAEKRLPIFPVTRSALKPFICRKGAVKALLDEIPALAVLALTAKGRSKFEGVGELAAKESDRLAGVCGLAKKLGCGRSSMRRLS